MPIATGTRLGRHVVGSPLRADRTVLVALLLIALVPTVGYAERLPIRTFTTVDGLAHNHVQRIIRDSRGFLWFCTREGLSRFDGYAFKTYGVEQGLPSPVVNDVLEARDGIYWIATRRGLARFDPVGTSRVPDDGRAKNARRLFTMYAPANDPASRTIWSLAQGENGAVWVGTDAGVYRMTTNTVGEVMFEPVDVNLDVSAQAFVLTQDAFGSLWIGTSHALYRRARDGRVETYRLTDVVADNVQALLVDRDHRLWVGTRGAGLVRMAVDAKTGSATIERRYDASNGLPSDRVDVISQTADGTVWVGTNHGVAQLVPASHADEYSLRAYARALRLPHHGITALAEDRSGNLWIGTSLGAAKWVRGGPTVFDAGDGLNAASGLVQTRTGQILAAGALNEPWFVSRFDGTKFVAGSHPGFHGVMTWAWNQSVVVDREGDWWIATRRGVFRFRGITRPEDLARAQPIAVYSRRHGLAADVVLRLFEDSRGDVWIATVGEGLYRSGLSRWQRRTGTLQHYTERDGIPSFDPHDYVSALAEDAGGAVWVGLSGDRGLLRYRDGRFSHFAAEAGGPQSTVWNLFFDTRGRLWIPTYGSGLGRIDSPDAQQPHITWYSKATGLSSNETGTVSEDLTGQIYVGTARGIDRIDAASGRIVRAYDERHGLPIGQSHASLRDASGALWFSYQMGLARFFPEHSAPRPPEILLAGVQINGEPMLVSELGQAEVPAIELSSERNRLHVEFFSIDHGPGAPPRYQFALAGADGSWSAPSEQRSVSFANLAPGTYRFQVRAINADGLVSPAPARFAFTIHPPIWKRSWFVTLAGLTLASALYVLHRRRLARALEVARLRARIATDLHDDIGANLTRIALLSEATRQQLGQREPAVTRPLATIANVARESVASMSDIVWAIHPERDRVHDLIWRMRAYAADVFAARSVDVTFTIPEDRGSDKLDVEIRRGVLLMFKEALNNAARHAECSSIHVVLRIDLDALVLQVIDNGVGFVPAMAGEGTGLASMRRRARALGADLDIVSHVGGGTAIHLTLPLVRSQRWMRRALRKHAG